jgi:hypothetical protein
MINVPQFGASEDLPNIIGLNEDNKICVIGETEEDVRHSEDHKAWLKKHKVRFINPFKFDEHGVTYAVAILDFYAHKILRGRGKDLLLGRLFYKCDYDIWLWNNDTLTPEDRYEFEYLLRKKHSLKVRNLLINGNPIEKPSAEFLKKKKHVRIQRQIADWTLRLFSVFWFLVLFIPLLYLSAFAMLWTFSVLLGEPVDVNNWTILGLLTLSVSIFGFVSFFLSMLLAAASWMYILRRYIPSTIMRDFLPSIGISKTLVNMLADKLLNEVSPQQSQVTLSKAG